MGEIWQGRGRKNLHYRSMGSSQEVLHSPSPFLPLLQLLPFLVSSTFLTVSAAAILQQPRKAGALGAADSLQAGALSPAHCGLWCSLSYAAVPLGSHLFILTLRFAWYYLPD